MFYKLHYIHASMHSFYHSLLNTGSMVMTSLYLIGMSVFSLFFLYAIGLLLAIPIAMLTGASI